MTTKTIKSFPRMACHNYSHSNRTLKIQPAITFPLSRHREHLRDSHLWKESLFFLTRFTGFLVFFICLIREWNSRAPLLLWCNGSVDVDCDKQAATQTSATIMVLAMAVPRQGKLELCDNKKRRNSKNEPDKKWGKLPEEECLLEV